MNFESQEWSQTELDEVRRLNGKHRDIRLHGSEVLERMAEKQALQDRQQAWVEQHGLSCFRCGATFTEWAKGGRHEHSGFWVICKACVRKPRDKEAG